MWTFARDLRFALRTLRARPLFTLVAALSLGLGIGGVAAVWALVDSVLLRPIDVFRPDRLLRIYLTEPGASYGSWTYADLLEVQRSSADLWQDVVAVGDWQLALATDASTPLVRGQLVSPSYFHALGIALARGRGLSAADPREPVATARAEVVLGHGLWQRRFGGREDAVGSTVRLGGQPFEVVGIAPAGFHGLNLKHPAEMWVPIGNYPQLATGFFAQFDALSTDRAAGGSRIAMWDAYGRLADAVPASSVAPRLRRVADALAEEMAEGTVLALATEPVLQSALPHAGRGDARRFLAVLAAAVVSLLAIASLNVMNLLLARAADRRRELEVRIAVGCSRGRLLRQLLTESAVLAGLGAGFGLLGATWAFDLLGAYRLPGGVTVATLGLRLSPSVLAASLAATATVTMLFGTVPALGAVFVGGRRRRPKSTMLRHRAAADDAAGGRLRSGLIAVQVALSLVLMVSAGLFLRSVAQGFATDLGFVPDRLSGVTLDAGMARYGDERALAFFDRLLERVRAHGDVDAAALSSATFGERGFSYLGVHVAERGFEPQVHVTTAAVSPGFFSTLGIRLLAGRPIEGRDRDGMPAVAIINRSMAESLWPGTDPVGQRFHYNSRPDGNEWIEVIGVVEDSRIRSLRQQGQAAAFRPLAQDRAAATRSTVSLIVRGREAEVSGDLLRQAVAGIDPLMPIAGVWTVHERVAALLMPERLGRTVLVLFAATALLLAAVGLAAVAAYGVARRQREIGVRMALGARSRELVAGFVRRNLRPTAVGIVAGLAVAAGLARSLRAFLYGVEPLDLATFCGAAGLFLAVAIVATLLPARAAARVDPVDVLRHE